jgi:cation diffusion facilitator CzcD-associated flavoprotein CzcO
MTPSTNQHVFDYIIMGAGFAGVNISYLLRTEMPNSTYIVFENRERVGGTWDFWKYPGIRSDSFLALFGLTWHPWPHGMDFAEAHRIRDYLEDAVRCHGLDKHIRLSHKVNKAKWSSKELLWTVTVTSSGGEPSDFKARYLLACTGYYDYKTPLQADIPGLSQFKGEIVHPQFWTPDIHT